MRGFLNTQTAILPRDVGARRYARVSRGAIALVFGGVALLGISSAGAGNGDASAQKSLEAAETLYLETKFEPADERLRSAIKGCADASCSPSVEARLHVLHAEVLVSGLKKPKLALSSMIRALELRPNLTLDPELDSKALFETYRQAKELRADDENDDDDDDDDAKEADDKASPGGDNDEGTTPASEVDTRRNWIRMTAMLDLALLLQQFDVCTAEGQSERGWFCARSDDSTYAGRPAAGQQNRVATGASLSTLKATLGYERVLGDNFTLGFRAGYAFRFSDGKLDDGFLPLHAEARAAYWFGSEPFRSVVRPSLNVAAGFGPAITGSDITVLEDGIACGAADIISGDCTVPTDPARNTPEPRVQSLVGSRVTGGGFASLGFGLSFSPTPVFMIDFGVRVAATFPIFTPVITPEFGMSFGF